MKKNKAYRLRIISHKARRSWLHKIRFRRKKTVERYNLLGVSTTEIKTRHKKVEQDKLFYNKFIAYKHIYAPKILSMVQNTEETLAFISKLEDALAEKRKVFIVLKHVEKIASGAIVVMLSTMMKFKQQGIDFNGDKPQNEIARQYLMRSGFFERLYQENGEALSVDGKQGILTHADKIVDSALSDNLIYQVSKLIWGQPYRCTGVQKTYIELMQNTNNHASLTANKEHYWYTTVTYNPIKHKANFAFIDYGVGIIESLKKSERGRFRGMISKILEVLQPRDNGDFLRLLLEGEVHRTATKKSYRGKGLPGIYKSFKDNKISNLVVISNDAFADCRKNEYKTLHNDFVGTYVSWELNMDNIKLPL